jgi:hypothetical protein
MATFSHKQYEFIARIIRNTRACPHTNLPTCDYFTNELVTEFLKDNPNFKPDRFIKAVEGA